MPCLRKARDLAYLFTDTGPTLLNKILNACPGDLGGPTSCPRKVERPQIRSHGMANFSCSSARWRPCDRTNMCIGYVATSVIRCHKAVLGSLLGFQGCKGGLAKRRTIEVEATFSSPSEGKKFGCRPPRGVVLYGSIVGGDVVFLKKCFILRISLCSFRKVSMTEGLGNQVGKAKKLDRASCPGPTRATGLGPWRLLSLCKKTTPNEALFHRRHIQTNILH